MTPEPVTLPVHCPTCGQPVRLTYTPAEAHQAASWTCPYRSCQAVQTLALQGSIVRAVARYEPPEADTRY
jgi:hypothetical protein